MGIIQSSVNMLADNKEMKLYILTGDRGRAALQEAESQDKYIQSCQASDVNRLARANTAYSPAFLNETDIQVFRTLFDEYSKFIPPRLLRDIHHIAVVILMPSADKGFPHTRQKEIVCFSQSATLPSLTTYIHELWHVHQRLYPLEWNKLFETVWNFKPYLGDLPENVRSMLRINPDTIIPGLYCWKNEWVPVCVFLSPTQPKLDDCAIWYVNIKTNVIRHSMPEIFRDYFYSRLLPASTYEHPNEMAAYMLSQFSKNESGPPAFKDLVKAVGITSLK